MKKCPSCGYPEVDKGVPCGCSLIEKESAIIANLSAAPILPPAPTNDIRWEPQGDICFSCGTSNPDGGDICGNCGENPQKIPGIITKNQLTILKLAKTLEAS